MSADYDKMRDAAAAKDFAKGRKRRARELAHQVMASLHAAMAASGLSYTDIAQRLQMPRKKVQRAFYHAPTLLGPEGLGLIAEIAWALDCRAIIRLEPKDEVPF